jgi:hypothetical protein
MKRIYEDLTIMNIKLSDLTLTGWLLTLVTLTLVVVLMIFSGRLFYSILPAGRYPAMLLIAPGLFIGIAFFGISALVLNKIGLPVVRKSQPSEGDGAQG